MRVKGYIDQIDLGADEETGQKNIIVHSASEFASLPDSQRRCAWATIAVAGGILEMTVQSIYYRIYNQTIPTKTVKKNATDLKGLIFVKPVTELARGGKHRLKFFARCRPLTRGRVTGSPE